MFLFFEPWVLNMVSTLETVEIFEKMKYTLATKKKKKKKKGKHRAGEMAQRLRARALAALAEDQV